MRDERFDECYKEYRWFVFYCALDMTQDYEAAEDISQEVFASLYKNIRTIVPGRERAWLCRATKNAVTDHFRRISHNSETRLDEESLDWEFKHFSDVIGTLEKRLDHEILIREILASLAEAYPLWYEALYLSCVREITYEEAARLCGVTPSVMRSRAYRARSYIREHFSRE